jgi:hypothetical protein
MTKRIKVKVDGHALIARALEYAIERGMNRHDKYSETQLSEESRGLLQKEIDNSFWLALSDEDAEIV